MPTFVHGKGTYVFVNEYDLSQYFNSVDTAKTLDTAETTGFGSSAKSYIKGLADGTISLSGMWSADAGGSDVVLSSLIGAATTPLITVAKSYGTIGNRCELAKAHSTNYATSNPVGDVVSITVDFNASTDATTDLTYGIASGVMLTAGGSIAFGSLGNLTSVDNAASSANGATAILHVTANSIGGGDTTFKVQHSANNSTWADLFTFTNVGAGTLTSEQKAGSGTINRYVRATASTAGSSGSITFHISFARF
jgi:hypothetical protein